jgi:putative nucleotidyltransferase with HDIG domain
METSRKNYDYIKHIQINELKLGMFIEEVLDANNIVIRHEKKILSSKSEIENLKKTRAANIKINLHKSISIQSSEIDPSFDRIFEKTSNREREYYQELKRAKDIHHEGVIRASEVLKAIRRGHSFSIKIVKNVAEEIVESILRNSDALLSLSQLKGYDDYTYVHSVNVAILITAFYKSIGNNSDKLVEVGMGGILHDIGKMRIPEKILNKPGKLTDSEFSIIKRHPEYGINAINDKSGISDLTKKVILQHHERYNGKGYPFGIKGERINEVGLISAVADVYDALTSDRVYKAAWTPHKAIACIFNEKGSSYSSQIVEMFTKLIGVYPIGSFVRLVTGEMGLVIRIENGRLLAPSILVLFNQNGVRVEEPFIIDLWKMQNGIDCENNKIDIALNPKLFNINVDEYLRIYK